MDISGVRPALGSLGQQWHSSYAADEVGQSLHQWQARFIHLERTGEQVVKGAVAHRDHRAGEADDVVGHAEVRRGQIYQQRFGVHSHKIAWFFFDWDAGSQRWNVKKKDNHKCTLSCC